MPVSPVVARLLRPGLLCLWLVAVVAAGAVACGDGSADTPGTATASAPTVAPSITPPAVAASVTPAAAGGCPVADASACTFIATTRAALQTGDVEALVAAFEPADEVCTGTGQGTGPAAGPCRGKTPGEHVTGYAVGTSEGPRQLLGRGALVQFLSRFALAAPVEAADDYGNALVRAATVGVPARPGCGEACLIAVYTYIDKQAGAPVRFARKVMTFDIEKKAGGWKVGAVQDRFLFPPEVPALLSGGEFDGRTYRALAPAQPPGPGGPFALGQTVKVAADGACAERRAAPSPTAAVVDCTPAGTPVQLDNRAEAGGTRYWQVRPIGPGSAPGWLPASALVP